jgi:hypothetical protein
MKRLPLFVSLIVAVTAASAAPINYTFDLSSPGGPATTLLVSAIEDPNVQIELSALSGTVQIDASGAGVLSGMGDSLDIEGGDRLIITPLAGTFVGPYTFVSATFGNVDTGPGNSGDEGVPVLDGVAGSDVTLPAAPATYAPSSVFNTSVAFENNDGNDDFRLLQVVINGDAAATAVPEPSTVSLLGLSLLGLAFLGRRLRRT